MAKRYRQPRLPKVRRPAGLPARKPLKRRGKELRRITQEYNTYQYFAELSTFGGTMLERIVDGAARQLNIFFDKGVTRIPFPNGVSGWVEIDRIILSPLTAIFVDGIQHELRPEVMARDQTVRNWLRSQGWRVVALGWRGLTTDPVQEVRKILYAF